MKKILLLSLLIMVCCTLVGAKTKNFNIELSNLDIGQNNSLESDEINNKITDLTKKTTYLLLGGSSNESFEEYYKRYNDYLKLRYSPAVPKDSNTLSGLDESSKEYKDDLLSGVSIPGMFSIIDSLKVEYSHVSSIRIINKEEFIISKVTIENAKINQQSKDNPLIYDRVTTDLTIYYYFKPINNEYKLYYVIAETSNQLNDYFDNIESNESTDMSIYVNTNSDLKDLYDFSNINKLNEEDYYNIYSKTINSVVFLNSFYNNKIINSGNGFFVKKGMLLTTWSFIKQALVSSQYITIVDNNKNVYKIAGIIKYDESKDLALLKLEEEVGTQVSFSEIINNNDAAITLSSKTGIGFSMQGGIVLDNSDVIQTSIPLLNIDQGSPLLNSSGELIGINTSKDINTITSLALSNKEIKDFINDNLNIEFDNLKYTTFEELKNSYNLKIKEENIKNNLSSNQWEKLKKEFDIENNIFLSLIKASSDKNIVTIRYKNDVSNYISGMSFMVKFKTSLEEKGYEIKLDSSKKCVYENKKYKIIITDEFNYIFVTMVKK